MKLLKIFEADNDVIKLKDGYNIKTIILTVVMIVICIGLVTSKMWLPDGRRNMTNIREDSNLNNVTVGIIENSYRIDFEEQIGEISFIEMKFPEREVEEIIYTVFDENDNELPMNVIKGKEVNDGMIINTDILVQFGVPKDIYYIKVVISQETLNYSHTIDYRDFNETIVIERDEYYLKNLNILEQELETLKSELEKIEENIEKETEEKKIQDLEDEKILIEHAIKTQEERIKQFKNGTYVMEYVEVEEEKEEPKQEEPLQEEQQEENHEETPQEEQQGEPHEETEE